MARSPQASQLTTVYTRQNNSLRARAVADVVRLWPALNPEDLAGSWGALQAALETLVLSGRQDAAALAGSYLTAFRALEGVSGSPIIVSGAKTALDAVTTSLRVTGPVTIMRAVALGQTPTQAARTGLLSVAGSVSRLILGGGRDTIHNSIAADKKALGYARVASGGACAFCAMVASRGPVYKSQSTARGGDDGYHDHCNCGIEPVYHRDSPWPANSRKYEQLWADSTAGLSGADARSAFRKALAESQ